ncbi:hypothetical protein GCM10023187_18850 [Nibrella viscosa]|uniref:DUF4384 domain-containing protein n=1 Tax=Nibrella viscosa TaxID=1084524 RepID=A0ABP8KB74_9BACT
MSVRSGMLWLIAFMVGLYTPAEAQPFSQSDKIKIAQNACRLIQDKYLVNMEILTRYETDQPIEALRNHINGLVRDAFRSRDVLVFNEFRSAANAYTTIDEYVKDCRIFSGGNPIINNLAFDEARYDMQRTPDGMPYINVYLDKQVKGADKKGKAFQFQNLTEFRVMFVYDKQLDLYHTFKIAGINKVETWPSTAFTVTARDIKAAEHKSKDLTAVLTTLAQKLKAALPVSAQRLVLEMFTYNRCGINDGLSDRIFATFSNCLEKQNVSVVSPARSEDGNLVVRGYYQEDLNSLRLVAELVDLHANRILAKVENADLPLSWISEHNLSLKPAHYQQVAAIRDTLQQHTPPAKIALAVELRTDRGRTSIEYWEGNQFFFEAKANRPCHLRLLYLLADGTKTLLEANFEIKPGQENRFVRIAPGIKFICAAPFGTEHVLVYAAEEPFCPIPTTPNRTAYVRKERDYDELVGSLPEIMKAAKCTRSRKAVAEDRLQITTRPITKAD